MRLNVGMDAATSPRPTSPLRALGVSAAAEEAYVALLRDGTAPDPARADELRAAGLLHRTGDIDVPLSVDAAVASWVTARAAEETALRAAAAELMALFEGYADRTSPPSVVRLLRGRDEVVQTAERLGTQAQHTLEEFVRAPFLEGPEAGIPDEQPGALERGVRYHVVYQSQLLTRSNVVEAVHESIALGEEARVANDLPLRLLIADRSRALVVLPYPPADSDGFRASDADGLLVESSSMLDALVRLFEQVWRAAAPLNLIDGEDSAPDAERELLLTLLSVGMTDAAIARNLGVSERTVHRRVSALATTYGVSSRFQLGAVLERRGLLPGAVTQPTQN